MAIKRVQSVTVYVSDQDKALEFYVGKLGFEVRADQRFGPDMRWLEVGPPGAETVIILARGYGDWSPEQVGRFSRLVLATDDIQTTYAELSGRGVRFTEAPARQPWGGMQALFVDQDGAGYVLVER